MNKTEREFAWMLEEQKREGKILRYEYEGITIKWAGMRYTPDFTVFANVYDDEASESEGHAMFKDIIRFIEVKGAHIWSRDLVRFKGARAYWPEFHFELWQKTKAGWKLKMGGG